MVHAAASQLHPRCTCLPSFCSVPLAERLSEKPNHSSHRFSSIVLATTFMHPSLPSSPLRAACPTPLTYNAPQQPPPSLYLPSTALSHALPSLTLSCFLSLSTFLVNEVPISPPTTKLEKDLVLGTSCKRVLREICLARKASVYARWLK